MSIDAKVHVTSYPDWKPGIGQLPVVYLTTRLGDSAKMTPTEAEQLAGWLMEEAEKIEAECRTENETREAVRANG